MRIWLSLACAVLLLGGTAHGQGKKPASFGALETMSAQDAKVKLAVWLKEVGKSDAATLTKLDAIWKDESRSTLDRMADSLALGDKIAASLIAEARDASAPAPIVLPAVFKDEKTSEFYRANLGLVYARALANRRVYEEALDTLKMFQASQVADPAAYLFHRAVCEHAMQQKPEATKTILRLLEEGASISPDRYKTVATLMLLDMHTWKDKDLGDIARKMDNIERRLEIARGGPETRRQQREVLNRLDEMIKKLENQNKNKKKPGDPKDGKPGDGDGD
jgi:tetrahydromethanopterin S-methyltransferase subunit G